MGGVDFSDQYMCYYSVGRKTMKWWQHVFWQLHDIAILNAFVIYCANHATSIQSNKNFWIELARMLCSSLINSSARRRPSRPTTNDLSRLIGKHFLYHTRTRSRCVVCGYKKSPSGKVNYKDKQV